MPPELYVFMGLIASGKSTLAAAFAERSSLPYYNTDVVRKQLAGVEPGSRQGAAFSQGIYTPELSRRTYETMLMHAAGHLGQGRSVVLDGSYMARDEREKVMRCAAQHGAAALFILCRCDEEVTRARLEQRRQDPAAVSDGTWEIYQRQKEKMEFPAEMEPDHLLLLDTARPLPLLLDQLTMRVNPA